MVLNVHLGGLANFIFSSSQNSLEANLTSFADATKKLVALFYGSPIYSPLHVNFIFSLPVNMAYGRSFAYLNLTKVGDKKYTFRTRTVSGA